MPSVSADLYEILSLAMRYVFVFLGLLIVLRTFRWMAAERREARSRLRRLPDSGKIGEFSVLQGSRELPAGICLPVPWEGVLGSVRTCDLVVPAEGVHRNHLDFSWQNGIGLLLHPRHGCIALINGQPSSPSDPSLVLRHGDCLTVGSAVLQLHLFVGFQGAAPDLAGSRPGFFPDAAQQPASAPFSDFSGAGARQDPSRSASYTADPNGLRPGFFPDAASPDPSSACAPGAPFPAPYEAAPLSPPLHDTASSACSDRQVLPPEAAPSLPPSDGTVPRSAPRRRSDRWKEDWSE